MKIKSFFTKLFQWEHWPTFMFYIPVIPYYIVQAIKAKHLIFYLAVNPAIKYSGSGTESKFETIKLIPKEYKPKTVLISDDKDFDNVQLNIKKAGINYPLIVKPDVGFRGYLVKKIDTKNDLENYLKKNKIDLIVQEFIDFENECGIFYHRIPGETKGKITSITLKKFLTVTGDGISSLSELIQSDKRAFLYYNLLFNIHKEKIHTIPKKDELIKLTVIGNHSKGTQFINGNHLITNDLELMLDRIAKQIKNWYFGRLDIKYDTFEKLKSGESFKILEINGIISEPTHIYDPANSTYFDALKSIKEHWKIMNSIARKNHDTFNVPYPKIIPYLKDIIWLRTHSKKIIKLNKQH